MIAIDGAPAPTGANHSSSRPRSSTRPVKPNGVGGSCAGTGGPASVRPLPAVNARRSPYGCFGTGAGTGTDGRGTGGRDTDGARGGPAGVDCPPWTVGREGPAP